MKTTCGTCQGTGVIVETKGHTDGNTRVRTRKCPTCNGKGLVGA
jgi:DnaJ-class molecular chaperone